VNQHVSALVVTVVGNQQASAAAIIVQSFGAEGFGSNITLLDLLGNLRNGVFLACVKQLHKLRRLAARCGAHVQHGHSRSSIDEERRYHADNFLTTDVSDIGLGDKELLERGERRESSNDVLGSGHGPGELIRVPRDWGRRLNELVLILNGGDLGNVVVNETLLNSQCVSVYCALVSIAWSPRGASRDSLPSRTCETEAVGEILLHGSPEDFSLLLWEEFRLIVIALELLVFSADILPNRARAATATTAAAATSTGLYERWSVEPLN
jgi:hypothetical protein